MSVSRKWKWGGVTLAGVLLAGWLHAKSDLSAKSAVSAPTASPKPTLSVQVVTPKPAAWPSSLSVNGSIAPWQEAVIGAELAGLRITNVLVNVGDHVRRGDTLATFDDEAVRADLTTARANLAEAKALWAEAKSTAERIRALRSNGVMSLQDTLRATTAEQTAQARVEALGARLAADELRLRQTRVFASDSGIISARSASVGSVPQVGQELFRLIRQGRLEWRAEFSASDLARVRPGMAAAVTPAGGRTIAGRVRMVAPTVDPATRNGIVYVDLPAGEGGARVGMFASGQVQTGRAEALTLPQSAVLLRDGFSYVFQIDPQGVVHQVKVAVGRQVGDRVEVAHGVNKDIRLVASGVGFLTDGDTVRVVEGGR